MEPRRCAAGHVGAQGVPPRCEQAQHFVPAAEGFGAAVRAGLGWGIFPDSLAAPRVDDGSLVRISDVHLDVPLFWQCWKLDYPMVKAITDAVAGAALRRVGE
jgi:LysR family transcriptional regulator, chromosome initiation inhibitor